ncbi:MAG: hypothetical protein K6T30_02465, partial [Alicyclobacillus sp.]|nr:hypothetical protein [Alicyclobacillus sp.]
MPQPDSFPVRQSAVFAVSEMVSYTLGLVFLSHFVRAFGMEQSALFRTILPVVGVISCFGAVGLPQALTRLFAVHQGSAFGDAAPTPAPSPALRSQSPAARGLPTLAAGRTAARLYAALACTAVAVAVSIAAWETALRVGWSVHLLTPDLTAGLRWAELWVAITPVSAACRGILLGLGATAEPAAAKVLEAAVRLGLLQLLLSPGAAGLTAALLHHLSLPRVPAADAGDAAGILVLTMAEFANALFLTAALALRLRAFGLGLSALRGLGLRIFGLRALDLRMFGLRAPGHETLRSESRQICAPRPRQEDQTVRSAPRYVQTGSGGTAWA